MKKIVLSVVIAMTGLVVAIPASADYYGHHWHHCYRVWHHHHWERVCR